MTSPIPCLQFDSEALPLHARFEQWSRAVAAYEVSPAPGTDIGDFRAMATAWLLSREIIVTQGSLTPVHFVRTREKAAQDGEDRYSLLLITRGGSWTGEVDGAPLTVGPGEVAVFDLTRTIDAIGIENDHITLGISRAAIAATGIALPDVHGGVLGGSAGRLVADHLIELVRLLPLTTLEDAPAIVRGTATLLAQCFTMLPKGGKTARLDRNLTVRHRIKRYIDQQLTSSNLTPESICVALGISRSTLYRVFAPLGGVAAYIRTRRLEAAHGQLADPDRQVSVASIGHALGFSSDAHFSKAFRQRFGFTPGTTRQHPRSGGDVPSEDAAERYRAWVTSLTSG